MTKTVRFSHLALYVVFTFAFTFFAGELPAQSTDETRPTAVTSYPITGNLMPVPTITRYPRNRETEK